MSTQEGERPTGSIAEAAARKIAEAQGEEPELLEAEQEEAPEIEEPEPEDAAEDAADEAEADLPDDASEEQIEEARQAAREEFYAGTYKTKEEADKGIAESALTIDRLHSERNYLQQQLAKQEEERQAAAAQEEEQIDLPAWEQWAAEAVESGAGAQGALDALTEGGYEGYQIYQRYWLASEDEQERAQAVLFNNEVMLSMTEARATAAAAQARAQPSEHEMEMQAHQFVKSRRPDFDDWSGQMQEVVEQLPAQDAAYLKSLAEQGAEGKARALEHLYLEARARGGVPGNAAQAVEKQRRKVSGDNARLAASSPTAEGTSSRTPPPRIEQEGLRRKAEFRERMNLPPLDEE